MQIHFVFVDDNAYMRTFNAKPPVKPIGRIPYDAQYIYIKVCECKGFSDDRPFSVYKHEASKDVKPFKVVFHWTNDKPKKIKIRCFGEDRFENDRNDTYMLDIIEEHATANAAKKAMRRFAKAAFDKVNESRPKELGSVCNCMGANDCELRLGDLVECTSNPGIVWRILSERKTVRDWSLKVEPVFAFLVDNGTDQIKEISQRDANWYVKPLDIVKLGTLYSKLGMTIADEARRRSQ